MFGLRRISSFRVFAADRRRARSIVVGATVGAVVLAASAGYTVVSGDTLSEIAKENGTSVSALVEANGIADPDLILTGQVLTIPGLETTHRVRRGETLGAIAVEYGVTTSALALANDLTNTDLIRIGQKLVIPTGGTPEQGGGGGGGTAVHVVKAGDTLASIAQRYGTTVKAILELNDIAKPSLIFVGTEITVSGRAGNGGDPKDTTTDTKPSDSAKVHVVKSGETLGDIAAQYGVSAAAVAKLNGLANPNRIRVGQKLQIPAGSAPNTKPKPSGPAFLCPVRGSSFVDDYGYVKPDGRFHQGIDMMAPYGNSVYAPVSGRVDAVNGTLGGMQFWLYGDNGNLYIGTHLSDFGKTGRVQQGDVIGAVGDSGNAIGGPPHVHFEILTDGTTSTNPYPTLRSACG